MTDRPEHGDQPPDSRAQDSRAEQVLSQALRAMVGGDRPGSENPGGDKSGGEKSGGEKPGGTTVSSGNARTGAGWRRLTTGQLLLIAAIVGLLIGIAAGLLSLLL